MSNPNQGNFLLRLWRGFWNGLTAFRMAVFNILFLLVLALVLRAVLVPGDRIEVESDTTLVIAPNGVIVEQFTGSPVERAINEALGQELPQTQLRDLLRALELAADDEDIVQVLIMTDRLLGVAPGTLTELEGAFQRFRSSGKPVVAYGSGMSQSTYALAALADEVWLNPDGMAMIEGYSYFRNYFREGLEKLKVDVNLFRVGEFKSAMEPFIRDSMSQEDRAAAEYFIGGLWQEYLESVARHRGMPVENLLGVVDNQVDLLEQLDGDIARAAHEAGLVDRLVTRPQARNELAQRGAPDDDKGFRQIGMNNYLNMPRKPRPGKQRVGIIVAQGAIMEGDQSPGTIGSESISRLLRQAARDDDIKAVVLRVDSGGGSAFASEVIRQELMALKESGKPVVVSMANVAASGGYWIAMGADEVWAYPGTITGSIGIFGFLPTFQNTLESVGIRTDGFGVAPLAGAFRTDREMTEPARRAIQASIEHGYREFIELVGQYRDMTPDQVDEIAQGRVWTGQQAQARGLIDQLGGLDQAVDAAARRAGIADDFRSVYVEREMGAFAEFLSRMGAEALVRAGLTQWPATATRLPGRDLYLNLLGQFEQVARARGNRPLPDAMAHCLCEAPL